MKIEIERAVAAPPEVAFATATDVARWPQFMTGITGIEMLTPGPIAVGTRFRETRVMYGRSATEEMTVAVLAPPGLFVLTAEAHGTRYRAEHRFDRHGEGTLMKMAFEGRPVTLLARLLTPLALVMIGSVKRQLAADLADLASEAERPASGR